ncbi:hypothetical protein LG291_25295 (plasmid) [Cytobacillus firmus]|uniref:hypothetical protein n=1 Tax=Bacillaceae TaxID=186817 RepID=UPI0004B0AFBB|nr:MULTISPECIES: hypothetical protein [Bacillaceae]MBN8202542.1 hypothetical protein [Bacillus sp. NTK034]
MKELGATLLLTFFVITLVLTAVFGNNGLKTENENLVQNSVNLLKEAQTNTSTTPPTSN